MNARDGRIVDVPTLTVAVCTRNRPGKAFDVLRPLDRCDVQRMVVDQSDRPEPAPRGFDGVWVSDGPRGLCEGRNMALRRSTTDVIWFVDDDVHLSPACLSALRRVYGDASVGAAVGRIVERVALPNTRRVDARFGFDGRMRVRLDGWTPGAASTVKGANMSFRRAALAAAGGFDPAFDGTAFAEDADASARVASMGWRIVFVPGASVVHDSAPAGGVRRPLQDAERDRMRLTGRWWARHRPAWAAIPAAAGLTATALARPRGETIGRIPARLGAFWAGLKADG